MNFNCVFFFFFYKRNDIEEKEFLKPNKIIHKHKMDKLNNKLKQLSVSSHNLRELE